MWLPADPRKLTLGAFKNHTLLGNQKEDADEQYIWQLSDGPPTHQQPDMFYLPQMQDF